MNKINIDIETFSNADLKKTGVYSYAADPSFTILLFAYSVNSGPVHVVDLAKGEQLPPHILDVLQDKNILKEAFNANFERVCISEFFFTGTFLDPNQWRCTMVDSMRLGLPAALGNAAQVLQVQDQKDKRGEDLIKLFSLPVKPTKKNNGKTRNYPEDYPEEWEQYIEYNRQDVATEIAIRKKLDELLPEDADELKNWRLDQQINDRGICVDMTFVRSALALDKTASEELMQESKELSGLANPNSPKQLAEWLTEQGYPTTSTAAAVVEGLLQDEGLPDNVRKVLENRLDLSLSSVKKYAAMETFAHPIDHKLRGSAQFYGAFRTGRWAGRGVQPQNLTKHRTDDPFTARELIRNGNFKGYRLVYDESPKDMLSQLVRLSLTASEGHRLIVSDFSAIEARVIAWFAGEHWRLDVFKTHGKIYEASAAAMFNVPLEEITRDSPLRQKGKVAELALGYQGGPGALKAMGALEMGLQEEELDDIKNAWRAASPNIVKFWRDTERAAILAIQNKGKRYMIMNRKVAFQVRNNILFIQLPSGRELAYPQAHLVTNKFGRDTPAFYTWVRGAWRVEDTYGGKLVENIVQATARDCLVYSMHKVEEAGYKIILHVHDELVTDTPEGQGSLKEVEEIMGQPIPWAPGLPLSAEGFETKYYMKD